MTSAPAPPYSSFYSPLFTTNTLNVEKDIISDLAMLDSYSCFWHSICGTRLCHYISPFVWGYVFYLEMKSAARCMQVARPWLCLWSSSTKKALALFSSCTLVLTQRTNDRSCHTPDVWCRIRRSTLARLIPFHPQLINLVLDHQLLVTALFLLFYSSSLLKWTVAVNRRPSQLLVRHYS